MSNCRTEEDFDMRVSKNVVIICFNEDVNVILLNIQYFFSQYEQFTDLFILLTSKI